MANFTLFSESQFFDNTMEDGVKTINGMPVKPGSVPIPIELMDFSNQCDNSSYVLDLTQGELQPLEVLTDEEFLELIDVDKLVAESQDLKVPQIFTMGDKKSKKECFRNLVSEQKLATVSCKRYVLFYSWLHGKKFS